MAIGVSAVWPVVIAQRDQGVKGQEKKQRSSHKDFLRRLHLGAILSGDFRLATEAVG